MTELGGHKSLYSDAYYDRETFDRLYGGVNLDRVKQETDPDHRLTGPLREGGEIVDDEHTQPTRHADHDRRGDSRLMPAGVPFRFTAYDGSTAGPEDSPIHVHLVNERGLSYLLTAPGDLGHGPRLRRRATSTLDGRAPGRPVRGDAAAAARVGVQDPAAGRGARDRPRAGLERPEAAAPAAAGGAARVAPAAGGLPALARPATPRPSTTTTTCRTASTSWSSAPSMTYTCAVFPSERGDPRGGAVRQVRPGLPQARPPARHAAARRRLRLGRHGPARRASTTASRSLGVTLSREQADLGAGGDQARGARRRWPRCAPATTATCAETGFDAVSSIGLTEHIGVRNYPAYFAFLRDKLRARAGGCSTTASPGPTTRSTDDRRVHRPLRLPRRRAHRLGPDHHRDPGRSASRCGTRRTCASTTR